MGYSQQVKEDAAKAAAVIRERGWTQGRLRDRDGSCCMVGACASAIHNEQRRFDLYSAIDLELGTQYTATWNDTPGRTKEEVLAVFERIANS